MGPFPSRQRWFHDRWVELSRREIPRSVTHDIAVFGIVLFFLRMSKIFDRSNTGRRAKDIDILLSFTCVSNRTV